VNGYKLIVNGHAAYQGDFEYAMPVQAPDGTWTPGGWMSAEGALEHCENGFHFCDSAGDIYQYWYQWGGTVYEVEVGDEVLPEEGRKLVAREIRVLRPLPHPEYLALAIEFVGELDEFRPTPPTALPDIGLPYQVFPTQDAARAAARGAAWAAAWAAAEAAVRDAARAVVWGAARATARAAAWAAAWVATWDAAWDAAWDAVLYCLVEKVCAGLPLEEKHRAYAQARWSALQQGYFCAGDVDGVLYLYPAVSR
jgi:hypothetical protein